MLGFGRSLRDVEYGKLSVHTVSFSDLKRSTNAMRRRISNKEIPDQRSYLLRYTGWEGREFFFEYRANGKVIKDSICQYLAEEDLSTSNVADKSRYVFGIAVYEEVARYFDRVSDGFISPRHRRDVRHIHVLEEHNALMLKRVEMLANDNSIRLSREIDCIKSELKSLVDGLRLLKIMLIMRMGWQEQGDLRPIAAKIREFGVKNKQILQRAPDLL